MRPERKREENDNIPEILTYGFCLRFAKKKNIYPCPKCQDRIHGLISQSNWYILEPLMVGLDYAQTPMINKKKITFIFHFLLAGRVTNIITPEHAKWVPCDNCQRKFIKILKETEFILGNPDYTNPPIEMWRKWVDKTNHDR